MFIFLNLQWRIAHGSPSIYTMDVTLTSYHGKLMLEATLISFTSATWTECQSKMLTKFVSSFCMMGMSIISGVFHLMILSSGLC